MLPVCTSVNSLPLGGVRGGLTTRLCCVSLKVASTLGSTGNHFGTMVVHKDCGLLVKSTSTLPPKQKNKQPPSPSLTPPKGRGSPSATPLLLSTQHSLLSTPLAHYSSLFTFHFFHVHHYYPRDDFCTSIKAGRLASALGTSRPVRTGAVPGEARVGRTLQGFAFGDRMGGGDAGGHDRNFYVHLCRDLWRPVRLSQHSMGLRTVHLLRTAAVDDVSGCFAAVCNHGRGARQSRQASCVSAGNSSGGPDSFIIRHADVWHRGIVNRHHRNST